jgi:hypothetical protein
MPRPPLPIGTWGRISTKVTETDKNGKPVKHMSRAKFRDHDGVVRPVTAVGNTKTAAERAIKNHVCPALGEVRIGEASTPRIDAVINKIKTRRGVRFVGRQPRGNRSEGDARPAQDYPAPGYSGHQTLSPWTVWVGLRVYLVPGQSEDLHQERLEDGPEAVLDRFGLLDSATTDRPPESLWRHITRSDQSNARGTDRAGGGIGRWRQHSAVGRCELV